MSSADRTERVVLVGVVRSQADVEEGMESLDELAQLAATAGAETVDRFLQSRPSPDPATYVGKGKAQEIVERARQLKATAIVFDDELHPAQGRNLEDVAGVNPLAPDALKIIDRTGLILDVFAQHAHSAEGKLQVELAQINYMVPRLRGWGEVMSRIGGSGGGGGAAGPSLGTRGPGETKLEIDRRAISRRLKKVKEELKEVERTRKVKNRQRQRVGAQQISLVGYTNAGKSTLLNAFTGAGVLVENKLFSTLDPVSRKLELPDGRQAVLTDTVGFVRKLPHQLVEAFKSTLEQTIHADLLLHVIDASQPDPRDHIRAVDEVLMQIGAGDVPRILAMNKSDGLDGDARRRLQSQFPDALFISALKGEGLEELLEAVAQRLAASQTIAEFVVPYDSGEIRSQLHELGEVQAETAAEDGWRLTVKAPRSVLGRFGDYVAPFHGLAEPSPDGAPVEETDVGQ
ncbi:MAG TPA: GTPase HflX [Actinomycetota bacterium]|nr:GTPase HflX [Actinomycetota bacterium]